MSWLALIVGLGFVPFLNPARRHWLLAYLGWLFAYLKLASLRAHLAWLRGRAGPP